MFFIIGFLIVAGCVVGGYMAVLWQPFEFVIIFGAAIGAFVIANPKPVLGGAAKMFGGAVEESGIGKVGT